MVRRSFIILAVLLLLLGGCAWFNRFRPEPVALPFPETPKLHFTCPAGSGQCWLSQDDANKLAKYLDELRAFQRARERLLTE